MTELNIDNPEYLLWKHEQLQFGILGGIKLEGLDRLRVTLKIEWKTLAIRHHLDLYNDTALDKLVKKCAERFSLGISFMEKAFAGLVSVLEEHRCIIRSILTTRADDADHLFWPS